MPKRKTPTPEFVPARKTKIVCTIGPASNSAPVVRQLLEAGMNVARINASHGTPEEHVHYIETLRQEAQRLK